MSSSSPNFLQRFSSQRRHVVGLLLIAALVCGWVAWRILQITPAQRHVDAGIELMQAKKLAQAEDEWREAVRLDPNNAQAWELLGDYYLASGSWPQASDAFKHVLKIDPETANVHARLASAVWRMDDAKTAQQQAQLQLKQDADNVQALEVLVAVASKLEHREDEIKYLKHLLQLQPQNVNVLVTLGKTLTESYGFDEAQPIIERILQLEPNNANAYRMRGMAFYQQKPTPQRLQQAEAAFKKVIELTPQDFEAHRHLGRVYMLMNKPHLAMEEFEAIGRGRPYASAHFQELATAYRKAGDIKRADVMQQRFIALKNLNVKIQELKELLAREPESFDGNLQLGLLLMRTVEQGGDGYELYHFRYENQSLKSCAFYLQKARDVRPQSPALKDAEQTLERVYTRFLQAELKNLNQQKFEAADQNLARALMLRPDDPRAQNALQNAVLSRQQAAPTTTSPFNLPDTQNASGTNS